MGIISQKYLTFDYEYKIDYEYDFFKSSLQASHHTSIFLMSYPLYLNPCLVLKSPYFAPVNRFFGHVFHHSEPVITDISSK